MRGAAGVDFPAFGGWGEGAFGSITTEPQTILMPSSGLTFACRDSAHATGCRFGVWRVAGAKSGVSPVASKDDLADFIDALRENFVANPSEWENATVDRFLDGMAAWVRSMDHYSQNDGQAPVTFPSWSVFADILAAAKIYE
jgi:hypothetical protein